ncbi:MAG: hypothetical protein HY906_09575 [Deltaproteobacteria bacterium]|nr:hypothetical protein [Deltaproteobacteria bacterium]
MGPAFPTLCALVVACGGCGSRSGLGPQLEDDGGVADVGPHGPGADGRGGDGAPPPADAGRDARGDGGSDAGPVGPVGASCSAGTECAGGSCLSQSRGWPGGYCSQVDCDLADPQGSCLAYGGDGVCRDVGDPGSPLGMCFDGCQPLLFDCRTGYLCLPSGVQGRWACFPSPL